MSTSTTLRHWLHPTRWPVRRQVLLAPAVALLCSAGVAAMVTRALSDTGVVVEHLVDVSMPTALQAGDIDRDLRELRGTVYRLLTYEGAGFEKARIDETTAQFAAERQRIGRLLESQSQSDLWSDEQRQRFVAMRAAFAQFERTAAETVDMAGAGLASAASFLTVAEEHFARIGQLVAEVRQHEQAQARSRAEGATGRVRTAQATQALGLAAAFCIAALAAWRVSRGVQLKLQVARGCAERLAAGDLREPPARAVPASSANELDALVRAIDTATLSLRSVVHDIRQASENVASGAEQIASGNADLSVRTERAAAALQQTASTTETLSATTRHSSENTRATTALVEQARKAGGDAGEAIASAASTMEALHRQSARVREVVSTISGLAFQTNLLALNAAVEAARAGNQGRGFAVVAGEVRHLAHRSAEAARQIGETIDVSINAIDKGNAEVRLARQRVDRIVSLSQNTAQQMQVVSAASDAQLEGVHDINRAVAELDNGTQHNAALVEEAAAAAASLREQARRMVQAVSVFALEGEHAPAA